MKYIILTLAVFLTGCVTPVKHSYPTPSKILTEECGNLVLLVENEERLSELMKVVTQNYNLFHECATKHKLLVRWIEEQKATHDAVFNK